MVAFKVVARPNQNRFKRFKRSAGIRKH